MRIAKLRKITGFWNSLFFIGNISKMRKSLAQYLTEEGMKCEIQDGWIVFEYDGMHFNTSFILHEGYAECIIAYDCNDKDYEDLNIDDKTYIADKVNTEQQNHVTVYSFESNIRLVSSFYFTGRTMMTNIFCDHFVEMTESLDMALDLVKDKIDDNKTYRSRRIGFNVNNNANDKQEGNIEIAAKV